MLVLTRKQSEQIRIGSDITITVVRVKGDRVGVGIEAPRGVRILRSELLVDTESADNFERTEISKSQSDESEAAGEQWRPPFLESVVTLDDCLQMARVGCVC